MKIIIAGGRSYVPDSKAEMWLISKLKELKCTQIICGCATGADEFGKQIGYKFDIDVYFCPPNWEHYGKKAGYIRNVQMAKLADMVILFPGGKGTQHMYNIAIDNNLPVIEYEVDILK